MGRLAGSKARSLCRAPQSAKSFSGVFFLIAFSFAAAMAKKRMKILSFLLAVDGTWGVFCRGRRRRRPAMVGELTNARSALVGVAETGVNALFDDFWYFSSVKSTRKEKIFYVSFRVSIIERNTSGSKQIVPYCRQSKKGL